MQRISPPHLDLYYTNPKCLENDGFISFCEEQNLNLKPLPESDEVGSEYFLKADLEEDTSDFKGNSIIISLVSQGERFSFSPKATLNFWKVNDPQGSGPLRKALRLKENAKENIVDLTAGFLKDGVFIWRINRKIRCFERNPYIYHILSDGLRREPLEDFEIFYGDPKSRKPSDFFGVTKVYLDPMYPQSKRSKSKAKKSMELLKQVCGKDEDEMELIKFALNLKAEKVVLKRPEHAENSFKKYLKGQIRGKNIRYDLY